jgi:hypothetical protein
MVIREIKNDIVVDIDYFVSAEQKEDFSKKSTEIIEDCLNCMKKRLELLTLLYD